MVDINLQSTTTPITTSKSILVIGDLIIDSFQECEVVSNPDYSDTLALKLSGKSIRSTLGGAVNVVRNLKSLGAQVDYLGPLPDMYARKIRSQITVQNSLFNTLYFEYNKNLDRDTFYEIKRLIDNNGQHLVRINPPLRHVYQPAYSLIEVLDNIQNKLLEYKAIVISDYNHGTVCNRLISYLASVTKNTETRIYLDSNRIDELELPQNKLYILKINSAEKNLLPLSSRHKFHNIITTLGPRGARIEGFTRFAHTDATKVIDSCGCGDTFLAALVYAHEVLDKELVESVKFAVAAGTCAVQKPGVADVNFEEVNNIYKSNKVQAV